MLNIDDVIIPFKVKVIEKYNENKEKFKKLARIPKNEDEIEDVENKKFEDLGIDRQFTILANIVSTYTNTVPLHINTWKRVFNYLPRTTPSTKTLEIIAKFFDCENFDQLEEYILYLQEKYTLIDPMISGFVNDKLVSSMLFFMKKGSMITVQYNPDRELVLECIDRFRFRVVSSKNSQLKHNNTFTAENFIKGLPLYVRDVDVDGEKVGIYRSGATHVITYVSRPRSVDVNDLIGD